MLQDLILITILLFFSSLFSGSETALISLDSIKIKRIQKHYKDTKYLLGLLADPQRFLTTLLIGNTLVNIMLSTILTSILIKVLGEKGLAVSIGAATFLLLIFGEITPKIFAIKRAEEFSCSIARPLEVFARAISPFRSMFNRLSNLFIKIMRINLDREQSLTQEELKSIIEVSHRHGVVKENEKEMIRSVLELTGITAQEIMSARPDIKALSIDSTQPEVLEYLRNTKHSKIPIFKNSIDNITGILYSKDLFFSPERDFKTLVRPVVFIPATKKINELLKDFQSQSQKIAIVVDEYGNTYGLVTLEDILEEVVGEIYDEFQVKESFIEKIDDKNFRLNGKASIEVVNDELNLNIPYGDYDTIAGYMLFLFKKIPQEGECIAKNKLSFSIEKLAGRRIKSIVLKKL